MRLTQLQTTTLLIGLVTVLTRVLTLFRDSLLAGHFGVSASSDDFFLVMDWAGFVTTLIATSAIHYFIPQLKVEDLQSQSFAKKLNQYTTQYLVLLCVAGLILFGVLQYISLFSGYLIVLACCIFILQSVCHYFSTVLNLFDVFLGPSFFFILPVAFNLLFFLFDFQRVEPLLWLYLLGCLAQFLIMLLILMFKLKLRLRLSFQNFKGQLSRVGQWMWLAVGTLYFPASYFLNTQLAATFQDGVVSLFSYGSRIPFAVSNLLIFVFWTVALPTTKPKEQHQFLLDTQDIIRLLKVALVSMAIAIAGYFLSSVIANVLYGEGIDGEILLRISHIQEIYFVSLFFQVLVGLMIRYLHIAGYSRTTILAGCFGLLTQFLVFYFVPDYFISLPFGFLCNFLVVGIYLFGWFSLQRKMIKP